MRWLELRIPPMMLLLLFAALAGLAKLLLPGWHFFGANFLAAGLVAVGVAVLLLGALAFRRAQTTLNPLHPEQSSRIVTRGIYRFSRNPMYLGFALLLAALALSHPVALATLPCFIAYLNQFQIKPEERALLQKFGSEFADYMLKVRRWL